MTAWWIGLGFVIGALAVVLLVLVWGMAMAAAKSDRDSERFMADAQEEDRVDLAARLLTHVKTIQPDELDDTEEDGEQDEHRK